MSYWFEDDNNYELLQVQERLKPYLISQLFFYPAVRYLRAAQYIGVETEISTMIQKILTGDSLPQSNLNEIYNFFAAAYRYQTIPPYQMKLFEKEKSLTQQSEEGWKIFFAQEFTRIAEDNQTALLVIKAVIYQDQEIGEDSIDDLLENLAYRFPMEKRTKEVLPETVLEEMRKEANRKNII